MMKRTTVLALSAAMLAITACGDGGGETVLPGVEAIVFAERNFVNEDGTHELGGMGNVFDYLRYVPGGGLYKLEPPTPDGVLTNLTGEFEAVDVTSVDVSFDGRSLLFSMRHAGDDRFHLWTVNVDGSGMRQLTFGPSDDVFAIYAQEDRVAFITNQPYTEMGTRADEYNHSRQVAQIATITLTGGDADRRVCSQNLSNTASINLLSDGRIGFSRWEHLGPVNDLKYFAMNPDCTGMVALAGQFNKPFNSIVQMQEIRAGEFIGIGTSREGTFQAGALIRVDARSQTSVDPNRLDVQTATFDNLTPQVPTDMGTPASGVGRYRAPFPLDDTGRLLVSWADGPVNESLELTGTAPDFGIYLWDPETGERTLIYNNNEMWDLYAMPVRARDVPPLRGDFGSDAYDATTPAVLGSVDVSITSLNETVSGATLDGMELGAALDQATRVRIIEGFSSEIGPVNMFGLTMHEGAAIVGEAAVYEDGSWEAAVPAYLPFHLQPLDEFGLAIRNQMLWIQAMPGEERRCGGCHESRSENILPATGMTTLAQQAGAQDFNIALADRVELPWYGGTAGPTGTTHTNIQDLFNAKCVSCHSGGAGDPFAGMFYEVTVEMEDGTTAPYRIPYLDLSETPLEVYYEMEVVAYPSSYVTLLYPSAMMDVEMVTGDMPPLWVEPGSARTSDLIAAINSPSEVDGSRWAYTTAPHPEDVGVDLTREERLMLIQMADLGGQYYSRRNVEGGFTPSVVYP